MSDRGWIPGRRAARLAAVLAVMCALNSDPEAATRLIFESVLHGEGDDALRWPVAVASAAPDELLVADAAGPRLVVFLYARGEEEWRVARSIPLTGAPAAIAGSAGGSYLVTTRGPAGLFLVDRDNWTLRSIGLPRGSRPGALAAMGDGSFLVHDVGTGQVLKLEASGALAGRVPAPPRLIALAAATDGGFYAADAVGRRVTRHGPDGVERSSWAIPADGPRRAFPGALVVADGGDPVVIDRHTARLLRLKPGGRVETLGGVRGHASGQFFHPRAIAVLTGERVAIADLGNGRVQILRMEERE